MATLRGSCQCGGVRFELPDAFVSMTYCHCTTCQKLSGGIGTANARVRTDAIRIVDGAELVRTYQPDEGTAKTFCPVCGANLFGGGWPDSEHSSVRLSAIDTPFEGGPGSRQYVRSLPPWATLPDDGLDRFDAGRT
ncbi:MAG TPA: GFA family protein [Gaiellaceae bacterium]|jgi:hypothetical protein|nr:GFA family protein [Gaiellaceae bacterium]